MTVASDHGLIRLLSALAGREDRRSQAAAVAQSLGAQDLMILLRDPELGILRPAPGLRQTLPGGPTWAELLVRCDGAAAFRMTVAYPDNQHRLPADIQVGPDGSVFILIGGEPRARASELATAADMLIALLRSETREDAALVSARLAGDATRRATALAGSLDEARAELARNARALQAALSEAASLNRDLHVLNETLEQRVQAEILERTKAEDALRHAQKMEAMGQLTGGVAHDFNNLLSPILGSLDMLVRRGVGNDREQRLIDGALQSAERAKVLVQRLLAFARRQPLQPTPVNLRRLVGEMAQLISSTTGPKVEVRIELTKDLPAAIADANQLEMALLNLAVNARDAMPDGGVLTISAAPDAGCGDRLVSRADAYVRLSVTDTGTGMDEATLTRATEPFFSTKGIGKGTGLGLSMVHGLALQLNGDLKITSLPGEGTTIDLWLPVSTIGTEAGPELRDGAEVPDGIGVVLLVDDEALVRMSTADMLADLGYGVVEADSAEEALRLVAKGLSPDLLVTDHLMPGMSGAQLAGHLRSSNPDLPILIISGYADAEEIDPALPLLSKPFRNAELAASLASIWQPVTARSGDLSGTD